MVNSGGARSGGAHAPEVVLPRLTGIPHCVGQEDPSAGGESLSTCGEQPLLLEMVQVVHGKAAEDDVERLLQAFHGR